MRDKIMDAHKRLLSGRRSDALLNFQEISSYLLIAVFSLEQKAEDVP